jgi:hypothetical protein
MRSRGSAISLGTVALAFTNQTIRAQAKSAEFAPTIPGPDPAPRAPTFRASPLTCDTHCHIFGPVAQYPYAAARPYTPPEAPLPAFKALHARIGIDHLEHSLDNRDDRVATTG